jgi:hypothetical protein
MIQKQKDVTFEPRLFIIDLIIWLEIQRQFTVFFFDTDAAAVNRF